MGRSRPIPTPVISSSPVTYLDAAIQDYTAHCAYTIGGSLGITLKLEVSETDLLETFLPRAKNEKWHEMLAS